jgi:hypothetical protein
MDKSMYKIIAALLLAASTVTAFAASADVSPKKDVVWQQPGGNKIVSLRYYQHNDKIINKTSLIFCLKTDGEQSHEPVMMCCKPKVGAAQFVYSADNNSCHGGTVSEQCAATGKKQAFSTDELDTNEFMPVYHYCQTIY